MIDQPDLSRQNLVQQMSKSIDKAKVRMPCIEYKDDMEAEKSFFAKAETAAKQEKMSSTKCHATFSAPPKPKHRKSSLETAGKDPVPCAFADDQIFAFPLPVIETSEAKHHTSSVKRDSSNDPTRHASKAQSPDDIRVSKQTPESRTPNAVPVRTDRCLKMVQQASEACEQESDSDLSSLTSLEASSDETDEEATNDRSVPSEIPRNSSRSPTKKCEYAVHLSNMSSMLTSGRHVRWQKGQENRCRTCACRPRSACDLVHNQRQFSREAELHDKGVGSDGKDHRLCRGRIARKP